MQLLQTIGMIEHSILIKKLFKELESNIINQTKRLYGFDIPHEFDMGNPGNK